MSETTLIDPAEFLGLEGVAHLACGGEAPFLKRHLDACARFAADKSDGMAGRDRFFIAYNNAKRLTAERLSVDPTRVAFLAHASEGFNQVAHAIDWSPGDNVVVADLEFPSGIFPFAALRERGVETRLIRSRDHYLPPEDFIRAIDGRTRLVVASLVSYLTGQRLDLAALRDATRRHGALLAIDATHAFGLMPVDANQCDFLVSSCYKWQLATHGVGVFVVGAESAATNSPATLGWHSVQRREGAANPTAIHLRPDAARFEAGNPGFLALYVLESALLRLATVDPAAALAHALALGGELIAGLQRRSYQVITPLDPVERAGNVCFLIADAERVVAGLAARGVQVWGSEGRVRVSLHAYNRDADVAQFFDTLATV